MPRIVNPDQSTREVDFLNPGDQNANGDPSILNAGGVDAGQTPGGISVTPVLNPGQDESAPGTAVPIALRLRQTTSPRILPPVTRLRNGW
jgi:hypothetical protein